MRFAYLGSGSKGNAAVVSSGDTHVLLDCGFRASEAERRLAVLGLQADQLSAIVVTHEHGDHIAGVDVLARRNRVPVFLTSGTFRSGRLKDGVDAQLICAHSVFAVGDLQVTPYPVPHDAREPCQYAFSDGAYKLGVLSDTGRITQHIVETLSDCDALALEFNHDTAMLAAGPYPPQLKARVGGGLGHLSNAQAAGLLQTLGAGKLQHVVLAHLSEQNNCPDLARNAAAQALDCTPDWIHIADQQKGLGWRTLKATL
ncbi:MBL fold metallo-hydrolase [bacterium]|nr:MBL fold metallo-hydrolase [bacterium]